MDKKIYLELRCPNTPFHGDSYVCGGEMAGISVETLKAIDFGKAIYDDMRYCAKCGLFWRVTLKDISSKPNFTAIDRKPGERVIDFVPVEKVFGSFTSTGGKAKSHG